MAEELGLGEMARGTVLTRGLSEAALLGRHLGAMPDTFSGLAGVGDLIPRQVASTERHHTLGQALARGVVLEDALKDTVGEAEGVATAYLAAREGERMGLELLLISSVNAVCRGDKVADQALDGILNSHIDLDRAFDLHT